MGRGREGVILQGFKNKKDYETIPMTDGNFLGLDLGQKKKPVKQTIVDIPEEVLNQLRQLNPRDVVNIIAN